MRRTHAGGNTGIGYETALVLLRKGYEVTLACRDPTRAGNAQQTLRYDLEVGMTGLGYRV